MNKKLKSFYNNLRFRWIRFFYLRQELEKLEDEFKELNEIVNKFFAGETIVWKPIDEKFGGRHFYGKIQSSSTTIIRIILDQEQQIIGVNPKEIYQNRRQLFSNN